MADRALQSLAILEVNWDRGRDYIEGFVPFIAEALLQSPGDVVSLTELQRNVKELFGFNVPLGALRTILSRARRRGIVKLENREYTRQPSGLAKYDLSQTRADVLARVDALITAFIEYSSSARGVELAPEAAEAALLGYVERHSVPILMSAVAGTPLSIPGQAPSHSQFLAAAFAQHVCAEDPRLFTDLEVLVKGSMLANVLAYPDLGQVQQRFDRVEVFLDTPLVLRAIGLATPALRAPTAELLDLLYGLNARLCCFETTLDETRRVLAATSRALQSGAVSQKAPYFEVDEYLIQQGTTSGDVELMIARLESTLRTRRIGVKPRPEHETALGVDEAALETALRTRIKYRHDEALHHDLDVLTAVHRIRRGRTMTDLESCKAIFVTSNHPLAQVGADFFRGTASAPVVPPVVLEHVLATLAWLKSPTHAPELPRKTLIANCHIAYEPPDTLWREYLAKIDQLRQQDRITDEDYVVLRFSTEARRLLMDVTGGSTAAFAEDTPEVVLAGARQEITSESERRAQAEYQLRLEAERQAVVATTRHKQLQERVRALAVRRAAILSSSVVGLVFLLLAYGSYAALPEPFPQLPDKWTFLVLPVSLFLVFVVGLLSFVFGTDLRSVKRTMEVRMASAMERRTRRTLGLAPDEDEGATGVPGALEE